jgi:hypothetical protein
MLGSRRIQENIVELSWNIMKTMAVKILTRVVHVLLFFLPNFINSLRVVVKVKVMRCNSTHRKQADGSICIG